MILSFLFHHSSQGHSSMDLGSGQLEVRRDTKNQWVTTSERLQNQRGVPGGSFLTLCK